MADGPITFALQALPTTLADWIETARQAEAAGFVALCTPDHPGLTGSPFVALGALAPATGTIQLGTGVANGGVREPLDLASDVATLDVLSGGRALLGIGAGHTPAEWLRIGRPYPTVQQRIDRLAELLDVLPRLIAGETVTYDGAHVHLRDARLAVNAGRHVPVLVGGSNTRLLRLGGRNADVVELSGTGRTLPDGYFHEVRWSPSEVDRMVGLVTGGAHAAGRRPQLGALVQHLEIGDDAERLARGFLDVAAAQVPEAALPSLSDALASPYVLVGTVPEIVDKLVALRARWGFTRYTVRSLDAGAALLADARLRP